MSADTFCFGFSYLMLFMGFYFKVKEQYLLWQGDQLKEEASSSLETPQIIKELKEKKVFESEEFIELSERLAEAINNKNFCFIFSAFTHFLGFIS